MQVAYLHSLAHALITRKAHVVLLFHVFLQILLGIILLFVCHISSLTHTLKERGRFVLIVLVSRNQRWSMYRRLVKLLFE